MFNQKHTQVSQTNFASLCVFTFIFIISCIIPWKHHHTFVDPSVDVMVPSSLTYPCSLNVVCNIPSQGCGWVGFKKLSSTISFGPPSTNPLDRGGQKPKHLDTKCQSLNDWSSSSQVSAKPIGEKLQSEFRPRH